MLIGCQGIVWMCNEQQTPGGGSGKIFQRQKSAALNSNPVDLLQTAIIE
jgi:hypothetical protein